MTFTNMYQSQQSKAQRRRERAAARFQTSKPNFGAVLSENYDKHLNNKLQEFCGMCRRGTIQEINIYNAAINVLAGYAKVLGKDHQAWLIKFNEAGQLAARKRYLESST